MQHGPLNGVLIGELGSRIASAVCGTLLMQLGATVIGLEGRDILGGQGKLAHRDQFMLGKLSLRDAASQPENADLLNQVCATCDLLITSSDADAEMLTDLVRRKAAGLVCDITAFGTSEGAATLPAKDWQIQAISGIIDTTGLGGEPPTPISLPIVEYMTGVYAAAACLAALRARRLNGIRQSIEVTLFDCAFSAMATFLPRPLTGDLAEVPRVGNRHAMICPWNVFQARDGWVLLCAGSDTQWQRLCELMERPELAADPRFARMSGRLKNSAEVDRLVQDWAGQHTVDACTALLAEAQIAGGPVAKIDSHPLEPNLDYRGMIQRVRTAEGEIYVPGSPLRMSDVVPPSATEIPEPGSGQEKIRELRATHHRHSMAETVGTVPLPLAGIKVIEIGHYTTVPLSTRMLASLGAEVIKIEPPEGEATRNWAPSHNGQGFFFSYMNSDKRSLRLDLSQPYDAAILRKLVAHADVLIENLKPGALARRGFSAAALAEINPRLIYCAVSGFGAESLYAGRPAFDTVVQAMSGMMDLTRHGDLPLKTGISSVDLMGAEMALLAVLAAIEHRDITGRGQSIDLSMQDISAWLTQTAWNGKSDPRDGVKLVRCADGFVAVEQGSHSDTRDAAENSRDSLVRELTRWGVRASPVLSVHEMLALPRIRSRNLWFNFRDEAGIDWPLFSCPMRLSRTPATVKRPMPALGSDNTEILSQLRRLPD